MWSNTYCVVATPLVIFFSGNESVSPQVSHLNYGQMNLEHAVDNNNDVQQDNTPQAISNVHYSNNVPSMYNNNTTTANEPVYR